MFLFTHASRPHGFYSAAILPSHTMRYNKDVFLANVTNGLLSWRRSFVAKKFRNEEVP